ncbi:NADH-quinone oxidoreductase subunit NuoG [Wenzhouxiangella marina]|uniref:NADH-quinone oxidoreductase n=1 Tax=Wenzhouxiangella marina TaxID=1579979 RepID=A0A0K0XTH4_9GAMM|nr:NADH-quinone oxidoreductase subunit NuoG [Wenzhouxiangella marina]AKS40988.1 NADH dehydrogenase subunit G [Wenzhouxiangella marina]MBB6087862.1 NADH-quinone oxidoreductase subunit G [Wenzhouxiangella marina]
MATVEKPQTELVTLEIDGREVQAPKGSMIIEASDRLGIDIPRFCYHSKLSIAANCRMCLVDVEKAPKPLPACATPVAEGMKVFTESRRAVDAQRGVMEFLLINHPLDCPICDQGGECELQDLAMGYGRSVSRFTERKRVVKDKNLGPLVATDMTRCIHCTRCVRFLEEIAGTAELGGIGRGEKTEISTFVERNINSELSGNIIDLCPVGALTNKPFRFSARPWEMRARASVAGHDCLGSNLFYHVRGKKIMRSVPRDNEAVNECWLADRDRYSHFGLEAEDRLTTPRIKVDGRWQEASWDEALAAAQRALKGTVDTHGAAELGALISPRATTEEHFLVQKLVRALGSDNIDHRLRLNDFSHPQAGRAHMDIASRELSDRDAIFLVGSNIRHDQPILGHRVRTAWRKHGAKVMDLNPAHYDCHFDLSERLIVPPQAMVAALARVAAAVFEKAGKALPGDALGALIKAHALDADARAIAERLVAAERGVLLLGNGALSHPQAASLRRLAEAITQAADCALCVLPGAANSQGAWRVGAVPSGAGLDARAMLERPRQGYLLWDVEPGFDLADPALAHKALSSASSVVAVTPFVDSQLAELADVLLPLAPVPETDGSYINLDSLTQNFDAALKAPGQARPGWKILRRLGEMLELDGFDFVDLAPVREAIEAAGAIEVAAAEPAELEAPTDETLWRIGDVGIYSTDSLVRRSKPLQASEHVSDLRVRLHPATAERLGLGEAPSLRVRQGEAEVSLEWTTDERIAPNAVWLPAATCAANTLGPSMGPITVEAGQ